MRSLIYRGLNWTDVANPFEHTRVMTTTLSNSNQFYDNADLTTNFTQRVEWGFMFATSAYTGVYTINQ